MNRKGFFPALLFSQPQCIFPSPARLTHFASALRIHAKIHAKRDKSASEPAMGGRKFGCFFLAQPDRKCRVLSINSELRGKERRNCSPSGLGKSQLKWCVSSSFFPIRQPVSPRLVIIVAHIHGFQCVCALSAYFQHTIQHHTQFFFHSSSAS